MKKLKYLLFIVIAVAISKVFYDSSVIITVLVFAGLSSVKFTSKGKNVVQKKKFTILYGIILGVCLLGGILITIGHKIISNDTITILGALLFAPTIAGLLIFHVTNLIAYVKNKRTSISR